MEQNIVFNINELVLLDEALLTERLNVSVDLHRCEEEEEWDKVADMRVQLQKIEKLEERIWEARCSITDRELKNT